MREALTVPLRSKIRRLTTSTEGGIIAFAKKGSDYVFKFAPKEGDIKDMSPEEGLKILAASESEDGYKLSSEFTKCFTELKNALFTHIAESEKDKAKRDAIDKVRIIIQANVCDRDYLEDLKMAIEHDSLSGYSLRAINRLKQSEFSLLPDIISKSYINAALRDYDSVSLGAETLIIAEELQNVNTNPQTELEL